MGSNENEIELELAGIEVDAHIVRMVENGKVKMPPFPSVLARVQAALAKGAGAPEVARLIGVDPALSAMLLRLVNSAMYVPVTGPIVALERAVQRLGVKEVTRVCMAAALGGPALSAGPLSDLRRMVWCDSLASAFISAALATEHSIPPEEAYVAGLLHDFGKILALSCMEDAIGATPHLLLAGADWMALAEQHHLSLGWLMANLWGLPPPLPDVIQRHHETPPTPVVQVVTIADAVIALMAKGEATTSEVQKIPGLKSPSQVNRLVKLVTMLPDVLSSFGVSRAKAA